MGDPAAVLGATSRTFQIPISRLPDPLRAVVSSAYLCMRAVDELEDHPTLDPDAKVYLLRGVGRLLQCDGDVGPLFHDHRHVLPPVTLRLAEWVRLAPSDVAPRVCDATAAMADRMADWAATGWRVRSPADLDRYTFSVAGAVGLLLSDLWSWHDGTASRRDEAVAFGRGLQAVNILRNRAEDLARGVDLFPDGWTAVDVDTYARRQLALADRYVAALPPGPALAFCRPPLALAYATLDVLGRGGQKLTRAAVERLTGGC